MNKPLLLMMLGLLAAGCATGNVDPARPHAGAGYIDFYTEPAEDLNWDVKEIAAGSQRGKKLFSELDPVESGILRLALAPGRHELRITFLNRPVVEPATVQVEVREAMITPVRITLNDAGTGQVIQKTREVGRSEVRRYGRATRISVDESIIFQLTAAAQEPRAYARKAGMPYALPAGATGQP
jgi:hypothetical protein